MHDVLKFHPSAEEQFNKLGHQVLQAVRKHTEQKPDNAKDRSWFQPHTSHTIKQSDIIGSMKIGKVDYSGKTLEKYFQIGQDLYGLDEEHYRDLLKIADGIHKTRSFYIAIAYKSIIDTIFDWVEQSYSGKTQLDLCNFLIKKLSKTISHHEIWVPIANLAIQAQFTLGSVTFIPIKAELMNAWQKRFVENRPDEKENIDRYFDNLRKKHLGWAAGMVGVTAESRRAREIAVEDVDRALALLRFFSPANFSPEINCNCAVFGNQLIRTETTFDIVNNGVNCVNSKTDESDMVPWLVNTKMIEQWNNEGLSKLSSLHPRENANEFCSDVANSLVLYSRVSAAKNLADKLVYLFASVESILLKDSGEHIQHVVSKRMARILGGSTDNKKQLISNFKKMYSKRSGFIHHAKSVESTDDIAKLMRNVWRTFFCIIKDMHSFDSKKDFLDRIDERKLGGSM